MFLGTDLIYLIHTNSALLMILCGGFSYEDKTMCTFRASCCSAHLLWVLDLAKTSPVFLDRNRL